MSDETLLLLVCAAVVAAAFAAAHLWLLNGIRRELILHTRIILDSPSELESPDELHHRLESAKAGSFWNSDEAQRAARAAGFSPRA